MKAVKSIPEPAAREAARDPWFDDVLDGTLWELERPDWKDRYATIRSAQSAIRQAAQARKLDIVIAQRGECLYVQAHGVTPKATPAKRTAKKATAKPTTTANGTAKRVTKKAAPKASTVPPGKS